MTGGRRRSRSAPSRSGGSPRWLWVILAAVLLVGAAVPASSFDTASLDRPSAIGVVQDTDGLLAIDHSRTVSKPSSTLVVVTNRFTEGRTISVALGSCTDNTLSLTTSGSADGVLVSNGGSSVTFTLPAGGSQGVEIAVNNVQCEPIVTRITTTDGLTAVVAERESTVDQAGPRNKGGGNNAALSSGVIGDG